MQQSQLLDQLWWQYTHLDASIFKSSIGVMYKINDVLNLDTGKPKGN